MTVYCRYSCQSGSRNKTTTGTPKYYNFTNCFVFRHKAVYHKLRYLNNSSTSTLQRDDPSLFNNLKLKVAYDYYKPFLHSQELGINFSITACLTLKLLSR